MENLGILFCLCLIWIHGIEIHSNNHNLDIDYFS